MNEYIISVNSADFPEINGYLMRFNGFAPPTLTDDLQKAKRFETAVMAQVGCIHMWEKLNDYPDIVFSVHSLESGTLELIRLPPLPIRYAAPSMQVAVSEDWSTRSVENFAWFQVKKTPEGNKYRCVDSNGNISEESYDGHAIANIYLHNLSFMIHYKISMYEEQKKYRPEGRRKR
ncbi:MAG: hypothetical protein ACI4KR_04745 [Ruminiclostridium sp.]